MSTAPLRVAISIGDPALARRAADLLSELPDLEIVADGEPADVAIVASDQAASADAHITGLTPRELEVLALMAEGASNKTIARRLRISTHTANFHVASVIDKLDAIGRTDAVTQALRLGVIQV